MKIRKFLIDDRKLPFRLPVSCVTALSISVSITSSYAGPISSVWHTETSSSRIIPTAVSMGIFSVTPQMSISLFTISSSLR